MRKTIATILKKRSGFTLVELCVTIGLMAMVVWIAGGAVYMAGDSYALTARMQDDEYAARTAMLNISRELHRSWEQVAYIEPQPIYDPMNPGVIIGYEDGKIKLWGKYEETRDVYIEDGELEYTFDKQVNMAGALTRNKPGNSPVAFKEILLRDFQIVAVDPVGDIIATKGSFTDDIKNSIPRLRITLVCENGLTVSTKVAVLRIPPTNVTTPGTP